LPRILLALLAATLALPSPSRADWLQVLPNCAMGDTVRRPGPAELLYPQAGLAAYANPGQPLVLRVKVPAPLTPPPGVQQERALRGWLFELVDEDAIAVGGARHHYRLRVEDVRPDGQSTLVYRVTVQLPPWLAPGTYDVRLRAPGSEDIRVRAGVRIGAGAPRLGTLRELPADPGVLRRLPVDVWLVGEPDPATADATPATAAATGAVPWLDRRRTFAVRVGDDLLTSGGCDDVHLPFAVGVARVGGAVVEAPPVPPVGTMAFAGETAPVPTEPGLRARGDGWVARGASPLEVSVVFPEGDRGLALRGASERLGFWPGTPVRPHGQRASVVGRWSVAPGAALGVVRLDADPPSLEVVVPSAPTTHGPTPVRVRSEGSVALAWEEDGTAYVPGAGDRSVPLHFHWLERREVHALAIGPRGAATRTATVTEVVTERPGCSASPGRGPAGPLLALLVGGFLCGRRRPRYTRRRPRE